MTPTGSETGSRNGELFFQLKLYAKRSGGWKAFDSSTGFRLTDGAVVSPDASLIRSLLKNSSTSAKMGQPPT